MRLRPIMMTTLAMIFGMLPIALAMGEGGGFRAPMARAVIGGLITSTLLTLVVVPVAYTYFDDFGSLVKRRLDPKRSPVNSPRNAIMRAWSPNPRLGTKGEGRGSGGGERWRWSVRWRRRTAVASANSCAHATATANRAR